MAGSEDQPLEELTTDPQRRSATGHSIWLVPDEPDRTQLGSLIHEWAERFNTPSFDPHITLLGELPCNAEEIRQKLARLAQAHAEFRVSFKQIAAEDRYFRSLILPVQPSVELLDLHASAADVFDHQPTEPYQPHLSLLYSHRSAVENLHFIKNLDPLPITELKIVSILLVCTRGEVPAWYPVEEFVLNSL